MALKATLSEALKYYDISDKCTINASWLPTLLPLRPIYIFELEEGIMATRILVTCKSHEMPGLDEEKNSLMANLACQKVWGRDYADLNGDRLTTFGGYFLYNQRCMLLIDNGPVDSKDYTTLWYKWTGQEL